MSPTLIATRGLPASGKTTNACAWVDIDPVRRARVNRDDLRTMLHNSVFVSQTADAIGTERAVTAVRDATITALLKRGVDVVCDDTNLPQRTVRDLRRLAVLAGATFQVWDLTDVPLAECLRRNSVRQGRACVPDVVIHDMHTRFIHNQPYPLPLADEPDDTTAIVPYVPIPGTPATILVDLDGTVALMVNRSPYDTTRVSEDRPNAPVIAAVRAMYDAGHQVVYCSGRHDTCREATQEWLTEHVNVPYVALHMRPAGDTRKDAIVKREIFDREIRSHYHVIGVFDDRNQVVSMWRSLGLTVFQVAEGNF